MIIYKVLHQQKKCIESVNKKKKKGNSKTRKYNKSEIIMQLKKAFKGYPHRYDNKIVDSIVPTIT